MGFLDRFIRQEVQGASPDRVKYEEELAALQAQQMEMEQVGYTGGQPLPPTPHMALPPSVDHETMKIYLKPTTPKKKHLLRGEDRFWILDDDVCTTILTSNLDKASQTRMEKIMVQARDLEGCDHVNQLISNLQNEVYQIVVANKARSDLGDKLRERVVPTINQLLYGESNLSKTTGERPKESRAILGTLFGGNR